MSEIYVPRIDKYVYLQPELNQSSLVTYSLFLFPIIFFLFLYNYLKRIWDTNQCDGDIAFLAPFFGSTASDWAKRCLHAPLEGKIFNMSNKINKLNAEIKRTSVFEPALGKLSKNIMKITTQMSLLLQNLKIK